MEPQPSRRAAAKAPAAGAFGAVVRQSEDELVLRHADFPDLVRRAPHAARTQHLPRSARAADFAA
jgi:hypothetical protein